jgi:hypothetical protein
VYRKYLETSSSFLESNIIELKVRADYMIDLYSPTNSSACRALQLKVFGDEILVISPNATYVTPLSSLKALKNGLVYSNVFPEEKNTIVASV